jgi:hypothetical protein
MPSSERPVPDSHEMKSNRTPRSHQADNRRSHEPDSELFGLPHKLIRSILRRYLSRSDSMMQGDSEYDCPGLMRFAHPPPRRIVPPGPARSGPRASEVAFSQRYE